MGVRDFLTDGSGSIPVRSRTIMIISRTPFRISFFGGGTDYPEWYKKHGGAVLGTTIDKYCYINCRYLPPFFEHRYCIVYSKVEHCQSVDEIAHPSVRETLRYLGIERGVEIHHDADIPARSGIGSSSAFTVGLLNACYALKGQMVSKHRLAMESVHLEQDVLKETVGSQDQVLAAYGGLNRILFHQSGEITVTPITVGADRIKELGDHLMLFYTGIRRTASTIAESFVSGIDERRRQLRVIGDLVDESMSIVSGNRNIDEFGELLHEAWLTKRTLSARISNSAIDALYDTARAAGAIGGKLVGAGGGGFLLLFVDPSKQRDVREKLNGLIQIPFKFDFTGSQIIFCDREEDYEAEERSRANRKIQPFRELS
jgi:D-glycero-alpha-D-manno-heptose-7-phosphate kinase